MNLFRMAYKRQKLSGSQNNTETKRNDQQRTAAGRLNYAQDSFTEELLHPAGNYSLYHHSATMMTEATGWPA